MNISFDGKRFVIECQFRENYKLDKLPNRRFDRRKKCWFASAVRNNCVYLLENCRDAMTEDAVKIAEERTAKKKIEYKPFPTLFPFKLKPFEHQMQALDFAHGLDRYAYFMDMGTGKTKTALDLNACWVMEDKIDDMLILCPINLVENWCEEVVKHCAIDVDVCVIESGKKAQKAVDAARDNKKPTVFIAALDSLRNRLGNTTVYNALISVMTRSRVGVVVDESHNVKGHESNVSLNVQTLTENAPKLGLMTGTPMSQGFVDLYMQYEILDPDILGQGSYYAFRSRYCVLGGYEGKQIETYQNVDELIELTKPYTFQIKKTECLDLPPKLYTQRSIDMTPEQAKLYREMDETMTIKMPDPNNKAEVEVYVEQMVTKYGVLQQIAGGFAMVERDPIVKKLPNGEIKTKRVREPVPIMPPDKNPKIKELQEIAKQHPDRSIIVWCKHTYEIEAVVAGLGTENCAQIHGGIPKGAPRNAQRDLFNYGKRRFMVANAATAGVGLNFVISDLVVYFSNTFRLVDREQSEDRVHRIGQTADNVLYVDLFARGTKDPEIYDSLLMKQDFAAYLAEGLKRTAA